MRAEQTLQPLASTSVRLTEQLLPVDLQDIKGDEVRGQLLGEPHSCPASGSGTALQRLEGQLLASPHDQFPIGDKAIGQIPGGLTKVGKAPLNEGAPTGLKNRRPDHGTWGEEQGAVAVELGLKDQAAGQCSGLRQLVTGSRQHRFYRGSQHHTSGLRLGHRPRDRKERLSVPCGRAGR
ncbi:hypothetical protein GCM10010448_62700 [Streptomyces glomeratus]|uniref:Uncharacterized protein n=1 Tax=Streptomyces glomeratus TaxID=284452 RepID=A0ABP6M6B2_9ACTN